MIVRMIVAAMLVVGCGSVGAGPVIGMFPA
jgi:hypothetical protein